MLKLFNNKLIVKNTNIILKNELNPDINLIYFLNCYGDSINLINPIQLPNLKKIFLINYISLPHNPFNPINKIKKSFSNMKIISNDIFFLHNKNYSVEYIGENDVNNLLNKLLYKKLE